MKIFDTFMYFNEDLILDIRLHELNEYVDKFVVVESAYTHSGDPKQFNFDINNYKKYSDKIIYVQVNDKPENFLEINSSDDYEAKKNKQVINGMRSDNYQRNKIIDGMKDAKEEDFILVSDIDEIPNLNSLNLNQIKSNIIVFNQFFFHYKLNLYLKEFNFFGTKGCKKKYLKSPQWLRNIKNKKYSFLRFDTFFSDNKYRNVFFVKNGGWHFSNISNSEKIFYKLKSYAHFADTPENILDKAFIEDLINKRKIMYDHAADKKKDRYSNPKDLSIFDFNLLPSYIKENKNKFKNWIVS